MVVDSATLQDLQVVPMPAVRGATLWSLINRTRSRVGREALRTRLLNLPHGTDDILALQRAHQAIGAASNAYRHALDTADADEVERYLSMTWQLPRAMPPLARVRPWYRQYAQ